MVISRKYIQSFIPQSQLLSFYSLRENMLAWLDMVGKLRKEDQMQKGSMGISKICFFFFFFCIQQDLVLFSPFSLIESYMHICLSAFEANIHCYINPNGLCVCFLPFLSFSVQSLAIEVRGVGHILIFSQ